MKKVKKSRYTAAKYAYDQKYRKEHYHRTPVDIPHAFYAEIKAAADAEGKPVNTWIKEVLREKLGMA